MNKVETIIAKIAKELPNVYEIDEYCSFLKIEFEDCSELDLEGFEEDGVCYLSAESISLSFENILNIQKVLHEFGFKITEIQIREPKLFSNRKGHYFLAYFRQGGE